MGKIKIKKTIDNLKIKLYNKNNEKRRMGKCLKLLRQ